MEKYDNIIFSRSSADFCSAIILEGWYMKKTLIKLFAVSLAVIMTFSLGAAGIGAFGDVLSTPAAAATYLTGDAIAFGSYPQSRVTDSAVLTSLNAQELQWISYGYYSGNGNPGSMKQSDYMKYADVTLGAEKYRAVTFSAYRPSRTCDTADSMQDENGYVTDTVYWFKYEPLLWSVLDPARGLVLCETIIDSQAYSNTVYHNAADAEFYNDSSFSRFADDYSSSSIRAWLNNDFYYTAFTGEERALIKTTTLNNSCAGTPYLHLNGIPSEDNVFLLSYYESLNRSYGFDPRPEIADTARRRSGTDYAKCQGLYVFTNNEYGCFGNSWWWLRSASEYSQYASDIYYVGFANTHYAVDYTFEGVCPAMVLNLAAVKNAPAVTGIRIYPTSVTLIKGKTQQVVAKVVPMNVDNRAYTLDCDNSAVATLDKATGIVTAVGEGTAKITATSSDGAKTAVCVVTVELPEPVKEQTFLEKIVAFVKKIVSLISGLISG